MNVEITLVNTGLDQRLAQIAFQVGNLKPAFEEIGAAVTSEVLLGFRNSVDPYGKAWAKIKPRPTRKGGNIAGRDKPLLDTGRLRNSMTYNADKSSVRIGTNVVYAEQHQIGIGVKQRKFLPDVGLPVSWQQEIMHVLNDYLNSVV